VQHQIARGVPSGVAADFAVDRADARSSGEVRFGAATLFAPGGEDAFVYRSLASGGEWTLRPRNVAPCRFARQTITSRECRPVATAS
jgi:hypothetical protein